MKKREKNVVLFTSPGCSWCTVAKKYLRENDIRFKTIDVSRDAKAAKNCQKHGCRGVPVVLIGSQWICGFDQDKIDKLLNI